MSSRIQETVVPKYGPITVMGKVHLIEDLGELSNFNDNVSVLMSFTDIPKKAKSQFDTVFEVPHKKSLHPDMFLDSFDKCCDSIKNGIAQNGIIIHANDLAIVKTIVIAYLIRDGTGKKRFSFRKAIRYYRALRPVLLSDIHFLQLQLWDHMGATFIRDDPHFSNYCKSLRKSRQFTKGHDGASFKETAIERAKEVAQARSEKKFSVLNLPSPPPLSGYQCKNCQATLFSFSNIIPHNANDPSDTKSCSFISVEPMRWMAGKLLAQKGKIRCYSCSFELGSWSWKSSQCICNFTASPAFTILKDNVAFVEKKAPAQTARKRGFWKKLSVESGLFSQNAKNTSGDSKDVKLRDSQRQQHRFIAATCFDELPKDLQRVLSRGKITPAMVDNEWYITCQVLRFCTKVYIRNQHPKNEEPELEQMDLSKQERESSKWKVNGIKDIIRGTDYEQDVLKIDPDCLDVLDEKQQIFENYINIVLSPVPITTMELTSIDIDNYCAFMEERCVSPGNPKDLFKLHEQTGKGGYGRVFSARHQKTKKRYAIKRIPHTSTKEKKANWREVEILSRCNHDNIVAYEGTWLWNDELWLVMELMEGGSFKEACDVHTFNESQLAYIAREILQGLKYLHSQGICHRDLKPGNIMLTVTGEVKLIDFGLCEEISEVVQNPRMVGSPLWMPPEIILKAPYNEKTDVWSLGCTLLQLVDPRSFDMGPTPKTMYDVALSGRGFSSDKDRSKSLESFLTSMMIKDPKNRASVDKLLKHKFLTKADTKKALKGVLSQIFVQNIIGQVPGF